MATTAFRRVAGVAVNDLFQMPRALRSTFALHSEREWKQSRALATYRELKRTPLFDFHVKHEGKMVPFAGWEMPIQYNDASLMESAGWCRRNAALFDVSHMCGLWIKGKDAVRLVETLVVGDIQKLSEGTGTLSLMLNEDAGIIDDTVVTKVSPEDVYMVLNAGCRDKDLAHIMEHQLAFEGDALPVPLDERCLLALQGPKAVAALQPLVSGTDLSKVYFGHFLRDLTIAGTSDCFLTRTGYTGEDGVELSVPASGVEAVAEALVEHPDVRLAGLGARDSLRLEAGLCLYGNDLSEDVSPLEASLKWTIGKRRLEEGGFIGYEAIKRRMAEGITRRRVGILSEGPPAREGAWIQLPDGTKIGSMTSGAYSPNLKRNVGMGYIDKPHDKVGTELRVVVRGRENKAEVAKTPFVPTTYYRG